jgi:RNA polymerase sigma-70 factor (ECF subfamily)
VKTWLSRAVSSTAMRGEARRNRFALWSRWFPETPTIDASYFQSAGEPYPGHWRVFTQRWPSEGALDSTVRDDLWEGLCALPRMWRDVAQLRDVEGRSAEEVSHNLQITASQQRDMLNRARATLRSRLARHLAPDDSG